MKWIRRQVRQWVMSLVAIEAVTVLRVERSDVLVFRVGRRLKSNEYAELALAAKKSLPFVRVMILDRDVELEVVKKA